MESSSGLRGDHHNPASCVDGALSGTTLADDHAQSPCGLHGNPASCVDGAVSVSTPLVKDEASCSGLRGDHNPASGVDDAPPGTTLADDHAQSLCGLHGNPASCVDGAASVTTLSMCTAFPLSADACTAALAPVTSGGAPRLFLDTAAIGACEKGGGHCDAPRGVSWADVADGGDHDDDASDGYERVPYAVMVRFWRVDPRASIAAVFEAALADGCGVPGTAALAAGDRDLVIAGGLRFDVSEEAYEQIGVLSGRAMEFGYSPVLARGEQAARTCACLLDAAEAATSVAPRRRRRRRKPG